MWRWLAWWRGERRRPAEVVLYTRKGCHLCDHALEHLEAAGRRYPLQFTAVDIDTDPRLIAEHGLHIPVVTINGRVRFRGTVNPFLLERLLRMETATK
jgi:hypothetical protein